MSANGGVAAGRAARTSDVMKPMLVPELMSTDLITLDEDQSFTEAEQIMKLERVRHLPVVKRGGRLVGLITHRDLLRAQTTLLLGLAGTKDDEDRAVSVRVGEFMSEALLTCRPITPIDDAARMMMDAKVGCMLVIEDERLVGMLTETDIMRWAVEVMAKMRFETEPPRSG